MIERFLCFIHNITEKYKVEGKGQNYLLGGERYTVAEKYIS